MRQSLEVVPFAGGVGAEVQRLDLAGDIADGEVEILREALVRRLVLVFRGQRLTPRRQAAFARLFGPIERHGFVTGMPDCADVIEIRKEPTHTQNFGGAWHSDNSYLERPPLGAVLHAIETPAEGGDTLWADQHAAYENLPPELSAVADTLQAEHRSDAVFQDMANGLGQSATVHPLVRTHPESGRRSLFFSGACTTGVVGWSHEASRAFLESLADAAVRHDAIYRHSWRAGDVVLWDNRATMHKALNDYSGERRVVRRVSIAGDRPY